MNVRLACSFITEANVDVIQIVRFGANHKRGWIIRRITKLESQNKEDEMLKKDLVAGSKAEKMSTIMKTYRL